VTDTPWNKGPTNLSGKKDLIRMSQERNQANMGARDVAQSQEGQLSIVTQPDVFAFFKSEPLEQTVKDRKRKRELRKRGIRQDKDQKQIKIAVG
jgi:hypothetical protein